MSRSNDTEWECLVGAIAYLKEKGLFEDFNRRWVNGDIALPDPGKKCRAEVVGDAPALGAWSSPA